MAKERLNNGQICPIYARDISSHARYVTSYVGRVI